MSQKRAKKLRKMLKTEGLDLNEKKVYHDFYMKDRLKLGKEGYYVTKSHTKECVSPSRKMYQELKRMMKTGEESRLTRLPSQEEYNNWRKDERITTTTTEESVETTTEGLVQNALDVTDSKPE